MGYYAIDPSDPPSVEEVINRWKNGDKAYDPGQLYHAMYPTEELTKYREYKASELRNRIGSQRFNALASDIVKNGIKEPIIIQIARDGRAKIGEGNHRHQIALMTKIPEVPVKFLFQQNVYEGKTMKITKARLREILQEEVSNFLREKEDEEHKEKMLDVADDLEDASDDIEGEYLGEEKKGKEVNPWAVCHTTVDKDKDPDKYERCVQDVKSKHKIKKEGRVIEVEGKKIRLKKD